MSDNWPSVEQLMKMAQEQPEALEAFRKNEVEKLIDNAPESMQRRLRGLQFQIDCKRKTHSSPMGACISISKMMFESFNQLNDALHGYQQQLEEPAKPAKRKKDTGSATVLSFTRDAVQA